MTTATIKRSDPGKMLGVADFRDVTHDFRAAVEARRASSRPLPIQAGGWSFLPSLISKDATSSISAMFSAPSSSALTSKHMRDVEDKTKGKEREWTLAKAQAGGVEEVTHTSRTVQGSSTTRRTQARSTTPFLQLALRMQDRLATADAQIKNLNQRLQKTFTAFEDERDEEVLVAVGRALELTKTDLSKLEQLGAENPKNANQHTSAHYDCIVKQIKTKTNHVDQSLRKAIERRMKNLEERKRTASAFFGSVPSAGTRAIDLPIPRPHTQPLSHSTLGQLSEVLDDLPVSTSVDRTTSGDQMVVMEVKEKEKDKSMVTKEYYEKRAQEAKGLLISFETVAQAFRELQQHILHQGGLVDVVGYNVEQSAMNIEKAEEQLIITVKEQSSNRGLYAKIFAVLLFFILVFFALL